MKLVSDRATWLGNGDIAWMTLYKNLNTISSFTIIFCFINRIDINNNCFIYNVKFYGVNLDPNGHIMKKKILGWEPSVETLYVRDGMLKGDTAMVFKVEGGHHYRSDFKTTYKWVRVCTTRDKYCTAKNKYCQQIVHNVSTLTKAFLGQNFKTNQFSLFFFKYRLTVSTCGLLFNNKMGYVFFAIELYGFLVATMSE